MMEKIVLHTVSAFKITADKNERETMTVGYASSQTAAEVKAMNAGWYGSDGKVQEVTVWQDVDGKLYDLKPLGEFLDISASEIKTLKESIIKKLSVAEIQFLKRHLNS